MGMKAEIRAVNLKEDDINRFEITAKDYVSSAALPIRITMREGDEDRSMLGQKLKEIFVSSSQLEGQSCPALCNTVCTKDIRLLNDSDNLKLLPVNA